MKQTKNKNLVYNVWSDSDPLDSFDVEATSYVKALENTLESLGWVMGEGKEVEENDEE